MSLYSLQHLHDLLCIVTNHNVIIYYIFLDKPQPYLELSLSSYCHRNHHHCCYSSSRQYRTTFYGTACPDNIDSTILILILQWNSWRLPLYIYIYTIKFDSNVLNKVDLFWIKKNILRGAILTYVGQSWPIYNFLLIFFSRWKLYTHLYRNAIDTPKKYF